MCLRAVFLADVQLDGVGGGAVGEDRASDTESLPPAVPEKTQAAYQVPTPGRDVMPPPPRPASETAGTLLLSPPGPTNPSPSVRVFVSDLCVFVCLRVSPMPVCIFRAMPAWMSIYIFGHG